ncbi:metal ABC transporter ATP-binding protein [Candidatus Gottesmanbacteria bacterium]|nr:metal ABC transporter ATP-binding protein [Candidatus Gottesmanbacteria bacterium]
MPITDNVLVSIKDVSFAYNGELVLDSINLKIKRGDFLGIIGPNGSGKTTLLKIMLGLLKPKSGSVDVSESKIGYVPQKPGSSITPFPITVEEVVALGTMTGGRWLDIKTAKDKRNITDALEAVGMQSERKRLLKELSGGKQQRVFIARALAAGPELLILDEPTVGVDVEAQEKFYQLLRNLNQNRKLTLVIVSHEMDVVAHEVNTIACLNTRLVCHGTPKEVLKSDFMEKLYGKELKFVVHGH